MLLAIDPGTVTGWALFNDARALVSCGIGEPPPVGIDHFRVLVEVPKARPSDPRPQDIVTLAIKAGEWGGIYRARGVVCEYLTPNDWKGSTKKDTSHARILRVLSPPEQGVVDRAGKGIAIGKVHNMMDAIGIGLHGVGRNANGR
jgi:hypothetical protein